MQLTKVPLLPSFVVGGRDHVLKSHIVAKWHS